MRHPERERYWHGVMRRQASSGQSITQFCRLNQVSESRFFLWRRKLQDRAKRVPEIPTLVPVRVLPGPSNHFGLRVRCPSGHVVEVDSADLSILGTLLQALGGAGSC